MVCGVDFFLFWCFSAVVEQQERHLVEIFAEQNIRFWQLVFNLE